MSSCLICSYNDNGCFSLCLPWLFQKMDDMHLKERLLERRTDTPVFKWLDESCMIRRRHNDADTRQLSFQAQYFQLKIPSFTQAMQWQIAPFDISVACKVESME